MEIEHSAVYVEDEWMMVDLYCRHILSRVQMCTCDTLQPYDSRGLYTSDCFAIYIAMQNNYWPILFIIVLFIKVLLEFVDLRGNPCHRKLCNMRREIQPSKMQTAKCPDPSGSSGSSEAFVFTLSEVICTTKQFIVISVTHTFGNFSYYYFY